MKLYLISQDVNGGYNTYDSAIVAARDEEDARQITPEWDLNDPLYGKWRAEAGWPDTVGQFSAWAPSSQVKVQLIGTAARGVKRGVVLTSCASGTIRRSPMR